MEVSVDQVVQHDVEQEAGRRPCPSAPFEADPGGVGRPGLAILTAPPNRDDPTRSDEHVYLGEVPRIRDHEAMRRIPLELRTLAVLLCVFDRERVEGELLL